MKPFIILILLFSVSLSSKAQTTFSGKVIAETKEVINGANIRIRNKTFNQQVTSKPDGSFTFQLPSAGIYILDVQVLGYEIFTEQINISNKVGQQLYLVQLIPAFKELQQVEVIGRNAKKYNSDYSFSATRTAALNKDIPQSISTVTKELITDRQAFQLADAVKISSGVIPNSYYNQYSIRGISQNEEGQIINGMRTRQYYFLQPLTSNVERVEVIKGPASATFSSVDPGGSINLVTKKPLAVDRKEISFSAGSFSTMRGTLDFTGP